MFKSDYLLSYLRNFLLRRKLEVVRLGIDWRSLSEDGAVRVYWETRGCYKVIIDSSIEISPIDEFADFPIGQLPSQIQFCGYDKNVRMDLDPYLVEFRSYIPSLRVTGSPEIAFPNGNIPSLRAPHSSLQGVRQFLMGPPNVEMVAVRLKPFSLEEYGQDHGEKRKRNSKKVRRG